MSGFLKNKKILNDYAAENYRRMLREPKGQLKYKFIVPGSCYDDNLWDWDSWLTGIALRHIDGVNLSELAEYEKGCVLNFLDHQTEDGRLYICIMPGGYLPYLSPDTEANIHKPCLCQHALDICESTGDYSWLAGSFVAVVKYLNYYFEKQYHNESGLFVWIDDCAIGVDNDPSTFYRPKYSSASIYLNCMMYKELSSASKIADNLGLSDYAKEFGDKALSMKNAVRDKLYDERDGFYYSGDVNLLPVDPENWLHSGAPRNWSVLIQRIDCWSGFMAMWAGIATEEQAKRMVLRYRDKRTFNAPYGVRTLGKCEKMYQIVKTGNPSCWLGPIWGISNYMVYEGLNRYGYKKDARKLAEKHLKLLANDIRETGTLHEYYDPETGKWVNNPDFQNWNLLGLLM